MKTNSIFNLGACVAAVAASLSGCYQTPEIDSQPEQEPKIVVDAKSEYTVASTSSDPVIFSISSNTPWYIENDAEAWCTPTPGTSATSSLTEDITVTIDDNTSDQPRTATLTITGEGVEEPVLVKITQNALSKLEVSVASGNIPQNGGNVTFTVLSDRNWSISSVPTWLKLSADSGTGSDRTETITASATETTSMRSATLRVENAEGDFRTVIITQEGPVTLKFSDYDQTARTFVYSGETKKFHIDASMFWKVSCSDPDVTISPSQGTTSGDIEVTLPYSKYINDKTYTITLESDDETIEMDPATLVITQSPVARWNGNGGYSGFTLTADGKDTFVETIDKFKYGEFIWKFSNVNITSGYFAVYHWTDVNLRIFFGNGVSGSTSNMLAAGGDITLPNGYVTNFGFDNGSYGHWGITLNIETDIKVNEMTSMRLVIKPTTRTGTSQNNTLSRQLYINDQLVIDNSENVGDIWQSGSSHAGITYQFGIFGNGSTPAGSLTIDSFEYKPIE